MSKLSTSLVALALLATHTPAQTKNLPRPGESFSIDGRTAFVIEPKPDRRRDGPMPWIWYAPTLKSLPSSAETWMFDRFLAAGIAIAGIDVGESYGSPEGRAHFQALFTHLTTERGYRRKPVLLARSRGGLMLYTWAVEHPDCVGGVAGIYPVCNLTSYPGLQRAAPAYGLDAAQLEERLADHNPVDRLAALAHAGVPILHIHGDNDRVVPLDENSARLRTRYAAHGGRAEVRVHPGRGHDMWDGWFQSEELTAFAIENALRPDGDEARNPIIAPETPNILVILADDMGIDAVSAFNPTTRLKTPEIDRLAAQGMSFTDAHSTSGVCSPTRYSVLTGRYNWRSRLKRGIVGKWERPLIEDARLTLPEMLRGRGYDTACIGKWHLGWHWPKRGGGSTNKPAEIDFAARVGGGPIAHGFDSYFGDDVPNWPPYAWREDDRVLGSITTRMKQGAMVGVSAGPSVENWDFRAVLEEYGDRVSTYLRERSKQERPFFLYVPMPSPHTPIAPHESYRGKTEISEYADFLAQTDAVVGRMMHALDESGLANDTFVIFTCDNGTSPKCNFAELEDAGVLLRENWRGWKADAYEGGHRVPFVVRWPGRVDAGTRCGHPVTLADIMATCADAVGSELPDDAGEDSASLLPTLRGDSDAPPHRVIVHHSSNGHFAIRKGKWKLLLCRGSGGWSPPREAAARKDGLPALQLYDLDADPKEATNLHEKHPEIVAELRADLRSLIERGRSTPGPVQPNHGGRLWWKGLPWKNPN